MYIHRLVVLYPASVQPELLPAVTQKRHATMHAAAAAALVLAL